MRFRAWPSTLGLRDATRRIPFHDSILVCAEALRTVTTVKADDALSEGLSVSGRLLAEAKRAHGWAARRR